MDTLVEKTLLDIVVNTSLSNSNTIGFDVDLRIRFYSDPSDMQWGKRREFKQLYSVRFDGSNGYVVNLFIGGQEKSAKIFDKPYNAKSFALYLAKQYAGRHDLEFHDNTFR